MKALSPVIRILATWMVRAINAFFIAVTAILLFIALFRGDIFASFLEWMRVQIYLLGSWNYAWAFFSAAIESFPVIGVLVPGQQLMLIVGGFFGADHMVPMILLAALGAVFGNYVGYFLGARYGKAFFRNYGDTFGLGKTELRYLEKQIAKNGMYFVILGKFHNFTRSFIPFIAGSVGMRARNFWLYNIIGSILWATSIILLGVVFTSYYQIIVSSLKYVIPGSMIAVGIYVYFFKREWFKQYIREKSQEIDEKIAASK